MWYPDCRSCYFLIWKQHYEEVPIRAETLWSIILVLWMETRYQQMSLHRDYFRCVTPPPRALRVELMSLISEVCSVVREAKNSPGSSSFCAAERLTFRCRPPLTWMEVKKHLTAQRNGSNSESFCTGAVSVSIKPRSPLVFRRRLEPFCAGYQRLLLQFQTEHNQQPTRWNAPAEGCESGFLWFAF